MKRPREMNSPCGRQKGSRVILALALGLGLTAATVAAQPDQFTDSQEFAGLDMQQVPHDVLAHFADVIAQTAQPQQTLGATITVQNCNDSGNGSLRTAVGAAASGDTIDLSQLSCGNIMLHGEIPITVASLTIKGKPGFGIYGPSPVIDGGHAGRVFNHTGTGTLKLKDTYLYNGHISTGNGGCVVSAGVVDIDASYVSTCSIGNGSSNAVARGGGVYAAGNINLRDGSWIVGNTAKATGNAYGGGLYTSKLLLIYGGSTLRVFGNSATISSSYGWARGGGLFAEKGILGGTLILENNTVEATGTDAEAVTGGGAFSRGTALIGTLTANDNHAIGPVGPGGEGGALYITEAANILNSTITNNDATEFGGGVYTLDTATVDKVTISGNTAKNGGGVYAVGKLTLKQSTVAENTARLGGGVYTKNGISAADSSFTGNHADVTGGGIQGAGDIVSIRRCTIADNSSPSVAGATLVGSATTPIAIEQSTISGNSSSDSVYGTGLYLVHDTVIKNSTITRNLATNSSGTRYGAGISLGYGVHLTLSSTIVAENSVRFPSDFNGQPIWVTSHDDIGKASGNGSAYDVVGSHNLIGHSTVTTPADTIVGNADLAAIADNGGPTQTHMPEVGSLAIDNGTDNGFSCDQRGDGKARVVGFAADIGALEVQADENTDRIFASGFEAVSTNCN